MRFMIRARAPVTRYMPNAERRLALRVLQAGAIAVVLVAAPYKTFDLDRFFVPKELVLGVTALLASVLCSVRVRRIVLSRADQMLVLWLILSVVSALFATNWWLAGRAMTVSIAGVACFWSARAIVQAGHSRALIAGLALAGVVGAVTALLQAYGIRSEFVSLNRAPGGTFGNRNFMAHMCVITMPALCLAGLRAPSRAAFLRWCGGIAMVCAALILSRSRAAWLALVVGLAVLVVTGIIARREFDNSLPLRRLLVLMVAGMAGAGGALVIPNTLDWNSESPYADTAHSIVNYKGGSGHGRIVQYASSLRMTLWHPLLGVGPGNWAVNYPHYASENDPSLGRDGMTSNPWPSSDWMAVLSERGPAALALLGLAILALVADGMRGIRSDASAETRVTSAVLLATLAIVLVVGAFDAVLLLAAPALVAWSLLGALTAESRERQAADLGMLRRIGAIALVVMAGAVAVTRSAAQLTAMSMYATNSRASTLERASAIDPGSYRIHARLAQLYLGRGDCRRSRVHAGAAMRLFPSSPVAHRLLAACGA